MEACKLKGTNNHQNHAEWISYAGCIDRVALGRLVAMLIVQPIIQFLAYAADRMGILVLCENRLMGTTDQVLDYLRRLIIRDRNHPSIIAQ